MKDWTKPNDPQGSGQPRGKDRSEQRHRNDPGWTGTEKRLRDASLKQFCKLEGSVDSEAYRNASCWDEFGRLKP